MHNRYFHVPSFQKTPYRAEYYERLISGDDIPEVDGDNDVLLIERNPSIVLPQLQNIEKRFFELVTSGNVNAVKDFLQENHGFNINCVNFQGVSSLHLAIQTKSEAMVDFLLHQKTVDICDCVLHAVKDNLPNILQKLLNYLEETAPGLEFAGCTHSSDFPDHITPLVLAAQCGHYEIIEMLMERGHRIARPHLPNCVCQKCRKQLESNDLLHAETRRLSLYKAISNPAYICHSSSDPILTSFLLSTELKQCAILEPEFRSAYWELSEKVSTFALDLIGFCRSAEEMEIVLKQDAGLELVQFLYPRIILAVDHKQKKFVAHPNTQQILATAWHGNWHSWKSYGLFKKILLVLARIVILPAISILALIMPHHHLTQKFTLPVNKMLSHTASYILFLVLIFLESNQSKKDDRRGPPHSGLEPFIILYVIGYVWSTIRISILQGPARYFRMLWSWYEIIMLCLFMNTFFFWIAAYIERTKSDLPNLERKYWHYLDPTLIAEGMFAIATIMAFFRLLLLCQLDYNLGPLQISLGKMAIDIGKFILIFTVIILAFSAGLCRLYHYYSGMVQEDMASGIKTVQVDSFTDFAHTLKTLFWALFCMAPLESADVIIENLPGQEEKQTIINKHVFTEAVGYIAFACFEVLCVIIILNMLIATMANTFQKVTDNVDVEWTFGRTQLYMQYMLQTMLPPPYNLIPTASAMLSIIKWIQLCSNKKLKGDGRARCSLTHCCYIDRGVDIKVSKEYPVVMSQLVQRYFREKSTDANIDEIEGLRQEINELKISIQNFTEMNKTVE